MRFNVATGVAGSGLKCLAMSAAIIGLGCVKPALVMIPDPPVMPEVVEAGLYDCPAPVSHWIEEDVERYHEQLRGMRER